MQTIPLKTLLVSICATGILNAAEPAAASSAPEKPATASSASSGIEVVPVKPVFAAEVTATGRIVPLYSAKLGCRLAAKITSWGTDAAGQPLDAGMAVKAGQKLFSVDPDTFKVKIATAEAAVASAKAAQAAAEAQQALAEAAVAAAAAARDVAAAGVAGIEARLKDKLVDEQRYQRLVEVDKTVSLKKLEEVRLDVETIRQQLNGAKAQVQGTLAQAQTAQAQLRGAKAQQQAAQGQQQAAEASLAGATLDLRDTEVLAPFDGIITYRFCGLGDYIGGAPFVNVLELTTADQLEAELKLPEAYQKLLVPGKTQVILTAPALRAELKLPVTRVVPKIDDANGTFVVRIVIPADKREGLMAGNFLSGKFQVDTAGTSVIVPIRALVRDAAGPAVMLAVDGKMLRRSVEVGSSLTEGVVIRAGLKEGDKVVSGPADQLKDGAPLNY
jgi:RND family efflux transporter MFP subunit